MWAVPNDIDPIDTTSAEDTAGGRCGGQSGSLIRVDELVIFQILILFYKFKFQNQECVI